jgi:hypothetical protein
VRWAVEQHGSTLGSPQAMFLVGTASGSTRIAGRQCRRRREAPQDGSQIVHTQLLAAGCRVPLSLGLGRRDRAGKHTEMPQSRAQRSHDRVPARGAALAQNVAPFMGSGRVFQRSENTGCTSSHALRNPAQRTLHDGANMAGERSTAGAHDGPRTDERLTPAWVRQREQVRLKRARVRAATSRSIAHVYRHRVWLMRAKWSYVGL